MMATAHFNQYQPGVAPYARRLTAAAWEQHRALLTDLHNQRVPRWEMLEVLADHGFHPSMGQFVSKMKQWDLMVLGERRSRMLKAIPKSSTVTSCKTQSNVVPEPYERPLGSCSPEEHKVCSDSVVPQQSHGAQDPQPEPLVWTTSPPDSVQQEDSNPMISDDLTVDERQPCPPTKQAEHQDASGHSCAGFVTVLYPPSEDRTRIDPLSATANDFREDKADAMMYKEPHTSSPKAHASPGSLSASLYQRSASTTRTAAVSSNLQEPLLRSELRARLHQRGGGTWSPWSPWSPPAG